MDDRRATVLQAVVEKFILDAQPVGSQAVVDATGLAVSPATIRHELGMLESDGYLEQPHTSAGRIPTEAGYRFFVDHLAPGRLDRADIRKVSSFFAHAQGQIEERLSEVSQLLSQLTAYAALVVAPSHDGEAVRSAQLVDLGNRRLMFLLVTSSGSVERVFIDTSGDHKASPIKPADIDAAATWLETQLVGQSRLAVHKLAIDAEVRAQVATQLRTGAARLVLMVLAEMSRDSTEPADLYVGGVSAVTEGFDAIETVRSVLSLLEEQLMVVCLLRDLIERGLSVAIGTETGMEPLAECSVVVAPYSVDGRAVGSVGLVGPTRMDYSKALAAVQVVSERLGASLTGAADGGVDANGHEPRAARPNNRSAS